MKKVLFIALHRPDRSPGQRFRFEQYFDYLEANGFRCELSYLITEEADKVFYKPGHYLKKLGILLDSMARRWRDVRHARDYDLIFIQREAFMLGSTFFERQLSKRQKMIFDFDDAVWLPNVSDANRRLAWLKNAAKTSDIIRMADLVFAGNDYLASYAAQFNNNVMIVPTTIDTKLYQLRPQEQGDRVCIGWSGSITTIQHFRFAIPALKKIKAKYGDKVYIKVIGDENYTLPELGIQGHPWRSATEVADLAEMDIGIMPLPDDEWTRGKCGLKGLQYMALGIPTLMSPVGVNTEIIQDGVNGFLPATEEEWVEKLTLLIESPDLRREVGMKGRQTVEEKYSVEANKDLYLEAFRKLIASA